jgi:anti-sigma factor RsiW
VRNCDAFRRLISPFLDAELIGEDLAAFEEHVSACVTCRASLAQERAVVGLVRDALPLYQAPVRLRDTVARLLEARTPSWISPIAAAAGLAAVLLIGVSWLARLPANPPTVPQSASELASLAARTHRRYAGGQLPLEVISDRPEELSRWFSGRVPFDLTLPDYPVSSGRRKLYHLAGGRLMSFKRDSAAFVAYRMEDRPISLFVTSADRVQPAGGEVVTSGGLRFHVESVEGLKIITWTHKGLTYALASDLDVEGSQSCLVCHGSSEERDKVAPLARTPIRN